MSVLPRKKPLLIYDGECGFCRRWVHHLSRRTSRRVDYAPFQEVAEQFSEIPEEAFLHAVQWVEPSGKVSQGLLAAAMTARLELFKQGLPYRADRNVRE